MRKTLTSFVYDEMLRRLYATKAVEDAGLTATNAELKYLADRFVGKKIEKIHEGLEEMPPESVTLEGRLEGRARMRVEAREFVEGQIEQVEEY